ncbi:MAG: carboxypeptidase-like regulatory domain-containing protein, partial [Planctomycetota bacterium]
MRNSPWSLLALATSIVALTYAALFLPTLYGGSGKRESVWNLLLDWNPSGAEIRQEAGPLIPQMQRALGHRNSLAQGLHVLVQVEDQAGNPLQGVTVLCDLVSASSIGRVAEGMTNESGQFTSHRLEPGTYEVQFEQPGFLTTSARTWTLPMDGGDMQPI